MVNLINKINKKVNTLAGVSNRIDSSKVDLNDKINDVPSAMQVADQKKLEPEPAKSGRRMGHAQGAHAVDVADC